MKNVFVGQIGTERGISKLDLSHWFLLEPMRSHKEMHRQPLQPPKTPQNYRRHNWMNQLAAAATKQQHKNNIQQTDNTKQWNKTQKDGF